MNNALYVRGSDRPTGVGCDWQDRQILASLAKALITRENHGSRRALAPRQGCLGKRAIPK